MLISWLENEDMPGKPYKKYIALVGHKKDNIKIRQAKQEGCIISLQWSQVLMMSGRTLRPIKSQSA
jgi:hypothetical protein